MPRKCAQHMHSSSLVNCDGMRRKCTRQPACVRSHGTGCVCAAAAAGFVRSTPTSDGRSIGNNGAHRNAVKVPINRFTEKSRNISQLKSKERRRANKIHILSWRQTRTTDYQLYYLSCISLILCNEEKKKGPHDAAYPFHQRQ